MRWYFISSLSKVHLDYSSGVDWVSLVWVDDNTKESRVCIDELRLEPGIQVVKDRGVIEISQVCHVFTFFKFWWVDLTNFFGFEHFFLKKNRCNDIQ